MARRMIDPQVIIKSQIDIVDLNEILEQVIIKSQIVDDIDIVDLNEILEEYGTVTENFKTITLQIYNKEIADDSNMLIKDDTSDRCNVIVNTAITISKTSDGNVFIGGLLVDDLNDMNFIPYIEVLDGEYENGIILSDSYPFDVHVVKV